MSNKKKNTVGILEAPGLLLGNAIQFTTSASKTLITVTEKLDGIADNLGEAAVLHSAIIKDSAAAKRLVAQYEHKALIAEIEGKYKAGGKK